MIKRNPNQLPRRMPLRGLQFVLQVKRQVGRIEAPKVNGISCLKGSQNLTSRFSTERR